MKKELLSGNEAIARGAYESGVTFAAGYPGTPSSEILESISHFKDDIYCEWSTNEKVAFEVAVAASLAGARSIVTMKHVGLNVAADPLMTFSYIGAVGGFVACVADDPGMHSSQNEQDTRHFARFAKIPIFEPANSQEAKELMHHALEISEKFKVPVILRSTTRVSHSRGVVELEPRIPVKDKPAFESDPKKYTPLPAWGRPMRIRVEERLAELSQAASKFSLNRIEWNDRKLGIVAPGIAYSYVKEVFPEASILKLTWSYPFPDDLIREFAEGVENLLIVEELENFLEDHIKSIGIACEGKKYIPVCSELTPKILMDVRNKIEGKEVKSIEKIPQAENLPARPPILCAGCPHRGVFYALGKFDVVVTGDIGCYSLGVFPPLSRIDTILCMGGGVSMAHGFQKAGEQKKIVGIVGDSTFFHSGITGLINIAYNKGSSTIIVVDNRTTAMTGHQEHPGSGRTLMGEESSVISIEAIGKSCGVNRIRVVDPYDLENVIKVLKEEIEADEPSLIVSRGPCILKERKTKEKTYSVDSDKCTECKMCLKLGCPAIEYTNNTININETLCTSCDMCYQVCKIGAINIS